MTAQQKMREALQAIADEAKEHGEYNSVSGVTRLPKGYTKIMNMACDALEAALPPAEGMETSAADTVLEISGLKLRSAITQIEEMRGALDRLERIATKTHRIGANSGPHWVDLAGATIFARATLERWNVMQTATRPSASERAERAAEEIYPDCKVSGSAGVQAAYSNLTRENQQKVKAIILRTCFPSVQDSRGGME